jgi:hypothetical protein
VAKLAGVASSLVGRPLVFVVLAFAVSRAVAYAFGVRFNANSIRCFPQIVDPELLRSQLLESLFYLHSQPPLFNLILGVGLKLFPTQFGAAMHAVYVTIGLALAATLYALLVRLGIGTWPSAAIAIVLSVSPTFILYENWLYYEYLVAALLILSAFTLHEFLRRGTFWPGIAFFTLLAALIYVRSIFQIIWLLLAVGLLLFVRWDLRRLVLTASAVPALLVVLLVAKNIIVFGVPGTSSWFGMQLAQVVEAKVPLAERRRLVQRGELSRVSLVDSFSAPTDYLALRRSPDPTGVPVLDRLKKSTGCWNLNHSVYIPVSRDFLGDAITLIRLRPGAYARATLKGTGLYLRPFHGEGYVDQSKIRGYTTVFDRFILLQIRPGQLAWTILLAYVAALLYGLRLIYGLLRRRLEPTASAVTLAYAWLTVAYVTTVLSFTQNLENGRIRFFLDPLVVVLLSTALHDALPRARKALSLRS